MKPTSKNQDIEESRIRLERIKRGFGPGDYMPVETSTGMKTSEKSKKESFGTETKNPS